MGKYGVSAFSALLSRLCRIYCGFAMLHATATRLYICDHRKTSIYHLECLFIINPVSELVVATEEVSVSTERFLMFLIGRE